ncbi:MAG: transglutaminase domain-containing protein [Prevotella sp.]|jgi:tetratricopeptide (TPR) repeat protein|nr:transglutaminase domain-containing protein [Prevotella sp.]
MKKIASLLIISLFSLLAFSQTSGNTPLVDLQKLYNAASSAAGDKDYKKAIVLYDSLISYYNHLPDKDKETISPFLGLVYYNKACSYSLLNNKEKALDNFEKAFEYKWNDYGHTLQDSDLDNIRNEKRFEDVMLKLKKIGDFTEVLKDASGYSNDLPKEEILFTYLEASDPNLVRIRQYFNLDSIAGKGDEISQIKNLMTWVHNRVRHDGSSTNPSSKNAIDIVKVCDAENRGVNCRMMATMLNECYLAMGFKSRFITCMPKEYIFDCHVINAVYSKTLNKWLWMDPTFNAYVSDEKGNLLGIAEVRERLRADKPLVLNEDANWNNQNKQTKEYYLDSYMAKNLYWLTSPLHNGYNVETAGTTGGYLNLYPAGYTPDPVRNDYITTNDKLFWEEY